MRQPDNQIGLGKHLAKKLYPVTLVIGFLISAGLPATYYALESNALRHAASIYAQNLSEKLRDLTLEAPALWKYQTYRYGHILKDLSFGKDMTTIRILDEAGRVITGYEYETREAKAWWNRYAPQGFAPILFNNRRVGTVQIRMSQGALLGVTLALLLFSTAVGVGLAVLVYSFPVRVIRGMEGEIQDLLAERKARAEEAEARSHQLEAARAVTEEITRELDLAVLLGLVNRRAAELVGAVSGTVYLWDEAAQVLIPRVWHGLGKWMDGLRLKLGDGVTGAVAQRREGMIVNDYRVSPYASPLFLERSGITAVLAEPLLYRDRFLGVITINNEGAGRLFTQEDRELLALFAGQAAIAIENARLFAESESLRGAAEASARRFSDLVQGLDAIVWEADAETFQFSFVSRRAEAVLGYPVERWLEDPGFCAGIIHPEDRERIVASCQTATAEGRDHQFEYRAVAADGRVVWIRNLVRVVRDADGRVRQLHGVMVDITQLKEAEEELAVTNRSLEAKNEELEAFVYTVTHDLRAPLVALQGMASMLAEAKGVQLDDEGRHYLDRLVHNTSHMERLIQDLLEFSRVGRLRQAPEAVAVAEVVDWLLLQWGDLLRERGVKVVCRDLPVLWGERTRIEQVYQNLIGNALKFLGADNPAPMIEVGAEDRGGEWECYVSDNGIGIDPAYHGKVFELFQRLREVEAEGTGIGLAIVKKIVELAGGKMWIESEAGKGATFRFTWPKGVREGSAKAYGQADDDSSRRGQPRSR